MTGKHSEKLVIVEPGDGITVGVIKVRLLLKSEMLREKLQCLLLEIDVHLLIGAVFASGEDKELAEVTQGMVIDGDSFPVRRQLCGSTIAAFPKQISIRIGDAFAKDPNLKPPRIRGISVDAYRGVLRVRLELGIQNERGRWR